MNKITVVGSMNIDMVIESLRLPETGETLLGKGFMTFPGGKGANQAVAAARLGGKVSMIGCVGDDVFGKSLIDNLKLSNVDTSNINIIEKCSTGVAIIIIQKGNNSIIIDAGANSKLNPLIIDNLEDVIKNSFMVLLQLEIPLETVEKTVWICKKNDIKVLLNPAPAIKLTDELLRNVDIITPNEIESEAFTGISIHNIDDAKESVKWFLNKGVKQVVITLGSNGAVYNNDNRILHKTVHNVNVVDTTAAGDSFSGALAVAISNGNNIDTAVDFANIVGSITVTGKGAQISLPTMKEVNSYIKYLKLQRGEK